jgi:large subunit ribosomal protein L32
MRRSHHALKRINLVEDKTTGEFKLPHHMTAEGTYNGRNMLVDAAEPQTAA